MSELSVRIRRGRRTDFTAAMGLLAACGLPVPAPERATLRRFRAIVADLGADFYVAERDGTLTGLVHMTYRRRLATASHAHLDLLLVAPPYRRHGIGSALLRFARRRAEKRHCSLLAYDLGDPDPVAETVLGRHGLAPDAARWSIGLSPEAHPNQGDC